MKTPPLPAAFQDLQSFVSDWALPNEKVRYQKLMHTELADLRVFFDAMLPRAGAIIALLKPHDPDALQGELLTLYRLLATFVETAHPIEKHRHRVQIRPDALAIPRPQRGLLSHPAAIHVPGCAANVVGLG